MQLASAFSWSPISAAFIHSCLLPPLPPLPPSLAFFLSLNPLDAHHASACTPPPAHHCWSFSLQFKLTVSSFPSSKLHLNIRFHNATTHTFSLASKKLTWTYMSEFGLNNKGHLILHKTQQCLSTIIQNILVYFSQLFTEGSKASFHPKLTQKVVT